MSSLQDYPQLGRYQVINRIASGGMAEVFLAKAVGAMGFQRLVALKLIHANFTRDEDFVKMFIDEARIAMHLHHRNIVQVFDLDKVAGTYFIAMEYVHGVNLYDLYERIAEHNRWIDPPLALYLIAEICKGLHFAHTRTDSKGRPLNIIHRDISPQNVLLSFEGEVKIADFGIATAAQRLHQTAAGIVKGKYAYMAPERLQEKPIDARVDVFSAGVLMYELLAGENPFAGGSAVDTIENVLQRDVPTPSSRGAPINRDLDQIALRAIARNPDFRFSNAQALADVLTEYAMDLTMARKDMAAGDAAVAELLAELFPERVNRQPSAASPGSLIIPGVDEGSGPVVAEPPPSSGPSTDLDNSGPDLEDRTTADQEEDDFDAPTVLKMHAVSSLEDVQTPRARPRPSTDFAHDEITGTNTAPTELPPGGYQPAPTVPSQIVSPEDDAFAQTVPSRASLETMSDDPDRGMMALPKPPSRLSMPRARPSPYPVAPSRSPAPVTPYRYDGYPPSLTPESHENLVVPVQTARRRAQRLNIIAAVLLAIAVGVVFAALISVRNAEPTRNEVDLSVDTRPPGATVIINGRRLERVTPVTEGVLANEPVVVELELAGYERVRRQITPRAGESVAIDESLRTVEGQLVVMPTPTSASVVVDGRAKGKGRVQVNGLPIGRPIPVRVHLNGYKPFEESITLSASNPRQTLAVPLSKDTSGRRRRATRRVQLTTPGTWATVYYRGQSLGSTPTEATLPVGSVKLRIRNDEARLNKEIRVRVPADGSNVIKLQL